MSLPLEADLLFSTIAVVFDPDPNLPIFRMNDEILSEILRRPLNIGNDPTGQIVISSPRDYIEIQLSPNKIDVRDFSGSHEHGEEHIPRVIHRFLQILDYPELTSYGINFVVEVPNDEPAQWIANTLVNPTKKEYFENLTSNRVHLVFQDGCKDITMQVATRGTKNINVNYNASESVSILPSIEELRQGITERHCHLVQNINALLEE